MIHKARIHKHLNNVPVFKRDRIFRSPRGQKKYKRDEEKHSVDKSMQAIIRDKAIKEVDDSFKNLCKMNIPIMQISCSFTRKDIYMIYSKFKALSKISKVTFPEIVKEIGVERSIFIRCLKEDQVDNEEFLGKIFHSCDKEARGYLRWEEFFKALKLITSRDLKDKIDLFFYIVDANGNGLFSFQEIKDICKMSFSKFEDSSYEEFLDELSTFFAQYIFNLLDKDFDDEIPVSDFKNAIYFGTAEQKDVLAMFCCAEAHRREVKQQEEVKRSINIQMQQMARAMRQEREIIEETQFEEE